MAGSRPGVLICTIRQSSRGAAIMSCIKYLKSCMADPAVHDLCLCPHSRCYARYQASRRKPQTSHAVTLRNKVALLSATDQ